MRITEIGSDYISVNEENYNSSVYQSISRIHLIKFDFAIPTHSLVSQVLSLYPKTNRFVVEDNIREYNSILRTTEKKYYVMNKRGSDIISFFRKNNKILFNFTNLSREEQDFFLMDGVFDDVLRNTEVIAVTKEMYDQKIEVLDKWKGNCLILNKGERI
jgi:hypothetical protein